MSVAMLARKSDVASKASGPAFGKPLAAERGKLRIGAPDDAFEREADRIAETVLSGSGAIPQWSLAHTSILPPMQRKCSCGGSSATGECEECKKKKELQRKPAGPAESEYAPPIVDDVLHSPGHPLDKTARDYFEPRFGHDFSSVRIHTNAKAAESARSVNARAYTVGDRIVFLGGQYSPHTQEGRRLLAHELTHVVQQGGTHGTAPKSLPSIQRKVILKHSEMKEKERHDFLVAHRADWGSHATRAWTIMGEMAAAGDNFDFLDENELKTEIVKRISTVEHMEESQPPSTGVPSHLNTAFGYPFNPPADVYGPRVNFAAKDYWTPGTPDNYALRMNAKKNEAARKLPRSQRHTVYGDQPMGSYSWKLTDKGKADPYTAIQKLFVAQQPHKRSLFHCDYLISVVNFMSLADSLGKTEFNKRVAIYGVNKIVLNWNLFFDLHAETALRDATGEFTSSKAKGLGSTQRVQPTSEKDLIIGDHVVFFNHLAYDILNERQGHAWRLENAVFVSHPGRENVYLGHGSGYNTNSSMRNTLANAFNKVVAIADPLIHQAKSSNKKVSAAGEAELKKQFPSIQRVGTEFHAIGTSSLGCGQHIDFKVRHITKDDVIGLHSPCDPSQMFAVERPIESKA